MTPPPWKVGELARRTGLTVRALHHYEEIGLLAPTRRSASGHRLYDRADVERLQQILSLRLMGLPLEQVRGLLAGGALSPRRVLDLHLARLREQIAMQTRLAARLAALAARLDQAEAVSAEDLCRLIEEMQTMERYFTPEQLETLRVRGESFTAERAEEVRLAWAELIPAMREAMTRGEDPASPHVQALAGRWKALVHEFTGGDQALARAAKAMFDEQGPQLRETAGEVPTPELFEYVGRAWRASEGGDRR